MPSLYAANSRIASLKRSMKAALMTPFVSSLALTWKRGRDVDNDQFYVCHIKPVWKKKIANNTWCQQVSAIDWDANQCSQYWILTLKSSNTSIWFWMMGIVLRSFSVFMVLITPSDLWTKRKGNALTNLILLIQISLSLPTMMDCFLVLNVHYLRILYSKCTRLIRMISKSYNQSKNICTSVYVFPCSAVLQCHV